MSILLLFIILPLKIQACNHTCLNCDLNDPEKCLSCPPSRKLNENNNCICQLNYQEQTSNFKSQNCFKCNSNCITCSFDNPNKCLSCGDSKQTNRILQLNGKCACQEGYFETKTSYDCKSGFDPRIIDFKERVSSSNNYHKKEIKQMQSKDISNMSFIKEIKNKQYLYDPQKGKDAQLKLLESNEGQLYKEMINESLGGEYFHYVDENLFFLAIKQYHQPQGIGWDIGINSQSYAQPYFRVINGQEYKFNLFQHFDNGNLLIQIVISDGLPIQNRRVLLFLERKLSEEINYYMQYFCLFSYKSESILGNAELSQIVDNLMGLILSCTDRNCQQCRFDSSGNEYCEKCAQYFSYNWEQKKCVCDFELDAQGECFKGCKNKDCVSCVDTLCIKCSDLTQNTCIQCDHGYYQNGDICTQCDVKCKTCVQADTCIDCADTYYKDNNFCIKCISPCQNCSSQTQCKTCLNNYYFSNNGCQQCSLSISNCQQCDGANICKECQIGYYLQSQQSIDSQPQCIQCPSKCQSCTSYDYCTQCKDGNYLEESVINIKAQCNSCTQNCTKCKNSSQCTQCILGYFEENQICKECDSNCQTCYGKANECYSCKSGKVLIEKNCLICETPCQTCEISINTCTSCIDETYYLSLDNKCIKCIGGCKTCTSKEHCLTCNVGYRFDEQDKRCKFIDPTQIGEVNSITCIVGYTIQESKCVACPEECSQSCLIINGVYVCNQCSIGYFKINATICQKCQLQCSNCQDSNICKECSPYYYLNNNQCSPCGQTHCIQCSSRSQCLACDKNYKLVNNGCVSCLDGGCCSKGSYGQNCASCNIACADCYGPNDNQCFECQKGYYLNEQTKQCKKCKHPSCLECSSYNVCLKCDDTTYLSSNVCQVCQQQCKTCTSFSTCTTCSDGYFMDQNNTCQVCSSECHTCINNDTQCISCKVGYFLKDNRCYQCDSNCIECISFKECIKCKSSYIANIKHKCQLQTCSNSQCTQCLSENTCESCGITQYVKDNSCFNCDDNCKSCQFDAKTCTSCKSGTYLDLSTNTCKDCNLQCKTCEYSNNNCISCSNNYYLSNNICQKCSNNCQTCILSIDNCTSCSLDKYLSNAQCLLCSNQIDGCKSCNNSKTCTSCLRGYYKMNNSCNKCPDECTVCTSSSECSECSFTSYKVDETTCKKCPKKCYSNCTYNNNNSIVKCEKCADGYFQYNDDCYICKSPCRTCKNNENECTSCDDGYTVSTNQQCKKCEIQNCKTCQIIENNISRCSLCMPDYELNNNQCQICNQNCKCNSGYYYDWDQLKCLKCSSSCTQCKYSPTQCTECSTTKYLQNQQCFDCSQPCYSCTNSPTTCTSCSTGLVLQGNRCQECKLPFCIQCSDYQNCSQCQDGYFLDKSQQPQCQLCGQSCVKCKSLKICESCIPLKYIILKDDQCQKCDNLYNKCDECNENGCTKCSKGYFLQNYTCIQCSDQCEDCNEQQCFNCIQPTVPHMNNCINCDQKCKSCTSDKCLSCQDQHYLSDGQCSQCESNCISCSKDQCQQCENKYYPQQSICIPCESNCLLCDHTQCIQCDNIQFYPNGQKCTKCQDICLSCTAVDSCTACKDGYFLNENQCIQCTFPCLTCFSQDYCLTCKQFNYYLNNQYKCLACPESCKTCDNDLLCNDCNEGYFLEHQQNTTNTICTKCQLSNCISCSSINQCTICNEGYYLDNHLCQPCSEGCQLCNNSQDSNLSICLKCDEINNYKQFNGKCYKNQVCNQLSTFQNQKGECQKCLANCITCSSEESCTECQPSFTLNEKTKKCDKNQSEPNSELGTLTFTLITLFSTIGGVLLIAFLLKQIRIFVSNPGNQIINFYDINDNSQN